MLLHARCLLKESENEKWEEVISKKSMFKRWKPVLLRCIAQHGVEWPEEGFVLPRSIHRHVGNSGPSSVPGGTVGGSAEG